MRRLGFVLAAALSLATLAHAQQIDPNAVPPEDPDTIVVPGRVDRPIPIPPGDPRTTLQRMADIRAWDRCVTSAQSASDTDPTRYQPLSPEEHCRDNLGMANRLAEPVPLTQ